nr:terminase gpA endonuclease subunit [Sporohalobacter salinus]
MKKPEKHLNFSSDELKAYLTEATKICSLFWAREYRVLNEESYEIFPDYSYLYDIYDHFIKDQVKKDITIRKAAQTGLSELAINVSLWFIDECGDVLYVLPVSRDASDFSNGRFDPALEESDYLDSMFTDVSNVGHKRAGIRNFYLRGSNSKSGLKSVPIDLVIIDEFDECNQNNIPLAYKRLDASKYKWKLKISTPTIPDFGIDKEYKKTDKRKWFVTCSHCSEEQVLDFFDNIMEYLKPEDPAEKAAIRCINCEAELNPTNGKWKPTDPEAEKVGYHINQLMSPTVTDKELVEEYRDALKDGPEAIKDFYNSKLGLSYVSEGDKLSKDQIKDFITDYKTTSDTDRYRSMGVDVGNYLHYVISEPGQNGYKKTVKVGKVVDFTDLDQLIKNYNVKVFIIDMKPEKREAKKLVKRMRKLAFGLMCDYKDDYDQSIKINRNNRIVKVDRTESFDRSLGRFYQGTIRLPQDTMEEYITHLSNLVRVLEEKGRTGEKVSRYKNTGPDHLGHANNYDELALRVLKSISSKNESDGVSADIL